MQVDARRYGELVERYGLSKTHQQAIAWVPEGARVLELGCASGYISAWLQSEKGCHALGVEVDAEAAAEARARGVDTRVGSLDDAEFLASLPDDFDVVMATDVLEHLRQPEQVLAEMHRWLRPTGRAIVAVPNIATWSMRVHLGLRGRFEYADTGILDRTHLRFYSWDSFHTLVERLGWRVEEAMADSWQLPLAESLLWEWPNRYRTWFETVGRKRSGWPGHGLRWLYDHTLRVMQVHATHAPKLGRRFPNLCATHVALLLSQN